MYSESKGETNCPLAQNPGGKQITEGCFKQLNVDGYDIEACFCNHDRCNGATAAAPVKALLLFVVAAVAAARLAY